MVKKTRKNIKSLKAENAYDFYALFRPRIDALKASHPDLYASINAYKNTGYTAMNTFLNTRAFEINKNMLEFKTMFETFKESDAATIAASQFKDTYKGIAGDDLYAQAKRQLLVTLGHIDNLRTLFKLYSRPRGYKLPTLYRGITLQPGAPNPYETMNVGDVSTVNQIASCSLNPATAISFQSCSDQGPCCLLRLKIDPDVKYIPIFWESAESYVGSEHEVILEPFAEFKLLKKSTARVPMNVGIHCTYNKFNKTGHLTMNVYDIQVSKPKKESIKDYDAFVETVKVDLDASVKDVTIALKL